MKIRLLLLFLIVWANLSLAQNKVVFQEEDAAILSEIFEKLQLESDKSTAELVVLAGESLLGTPYVAHTLESEKEQLIVNLRGMDCTTYAENCLAIARCVKNGNTSFFAFAGELQKIRYRFGVIDNYPSRLHYFSDWIFENEQQGFVKQYSKQITNTVYPLRVDFMSTHPDSYPQLKSNKDFVDALAKKEKEISKRKMFYIPEDQISGHETQLKAGDIVGITTSIAGLDMSHVGILVRINGRIHLMHASSSAKKVVISKNTLEDYLRAGKSTTGIAVVRPL
ncbi:N-acetylmuramoyl-L-alanine amidase-like domain-containing protein [Maribellus mangrovi]|uniref:N-acetylmuramoyl-L-alanine amidase-like domain-containing protein n=1 Tax=Maribellus mangrovi TaxID=3133146 RepID=UPI0030EEF033